MNLVLIPGFMTDETLWRDMAPQLATLGNIFYGDLTQGENLREIAIHNLATTPDRYVLVGFSLGGYIARWMASLAPESIAALVLIATSNQPDSDVQKAVKARTAQAVNLASFAGLSASTVRTSLHAENKNNKLLIEHIRNMSLRLGPDMFVRQLGLQREGIPTPELDCPVLIVASASDELRTLTEAEDLQSQFPGSTLKIISGAGHMLPLEQPYELTKLIISWLVQHGLSPLPTEQ
ncbi:alpha/beta fold hydrolase [Serratia proteamaculans]|jgi:pimeloyl-ACP methyl ester carboxylesterase|uniref:alpha/beta fold hydrolase n=1 Tax=Serratia proteamaculans TaxID=28151 RepID=UPI0039AF4692